MSIILFCLVKEEEEQEEITPELVARLVTRPEDLPQNVATSIKKYRDMMLRTLEVGMHTLINHSKVIVSGNNFMYITTCSC